ncbi:MAG TPA: ankyrin repeat domain-containing protein [Planctomycetaceae bacterium]|nr:ankyrin repeat domain-containing protein [Planctomycetaceae bacterium]
MTLVECVEHGTSAQLKAFLHDHPNQKPVELAEALSAASFREDGEKVIVLLDYGAPLDIHPQNRWPALHNAVEQMNFELVRLLHERGADVNFPDSSGWTPLHHAVDTEADCAWQAEETPTGELVELLLALGAKTEVRDERGRTPLDVARDYQFGRAIELLTTKPYPCRPH